MTEEWIREVAEFVAGAIDVAMIAVVSIGTVHTLWRVFDRVVHREALSEVVRDIWLRYASWIVLALEFALAADLIETVVAPSWQEIGQLGAIAVIRILLGYFLGKDIAEYRERKPDHA